MAPSKKSTSKKSSAKKRSSSGGKPSLEERIEILEDLAGVDARKQLAAEGEKPTSPAAKRLKTEHDAKVEERKEERESVEDGTALGPHDR
jgi:hypothetical protein